MQHENPITLWSRLRPLAPFIAVSVAYLVLAWIFIGVRALPTVIILAAFMLLFVEASHRQNDKDRKFLRRMVGIAVIACSIWACITLLTYPVAALTVTGEPDGAQIEWTIADGTGPYTVWLNDGRLYDEYPGTSLITDTEPGKAYRMVVWENDTEPVSALVRAPFYTYPLEVWVLFALLVGLMVASVRVPYAAFGAALIGGFLMLMIGPNPAYAGYLRLIACAAFIAGLGCLFSGGGGK